VAESSHITSRARGYRRELSAQETDELGVRAGRALEQAVPDELRGDATAATAC
jgi:hypothetical protein